MRQPFSTCSCALRPHRGSKNGSFEADETIHAPHLIDAEVAQVLRRYTLSGELQAERGREALADFQALPIVRYPHDLFLQRMWELRANVTAYDAAYLALAETLSAPLLTRGRRLAKTAGHWAVVEIVG